MITNQEGIEVVSDSLQLLRHCNGLGGPELKPVQSRLQPVAQFCGLTLVPEMQDICVSIQPPGITNRFTEQILYYLRFES